MHRGEYVGARNGRATGIAMVLLGMTGLVCVSCKDGLSDTGCVEGMVQVEGLEGPLCIHAFEVHVEAVQQGADVKEVLLADPTQVRLRSELGLMPTKTTWYRAEAACKAHGFHLCTSQEWEDACDGVPGEGGAEFPTVDGAYTTGDCSFTELPGEDRRPLVKTGSYRRCHTPTGIYDMAGNLWEWSDPGVRDEANLPQVDKRGGGHYGRDSVGCAYSSVGSHPPNFEGTIGFRCCATP